MLALIIDGLFFLVTLDFFWVSQPLIPSLIVSLYSLSHLQWNDQLLSAHFQNPFLLEFIFIKIMQNWFLIISVATNRFLVPLLIWSSTSVCSSSFSSIHTPDIIRYKVVLFLFQLSLWVLFKNWRSSSNQWYWRQYLVYPLLASIVLVWVFLEFFGLYSRGSAVIDINSVVNSDMLNDTNSVGIAFIGNTNVISTIEDKTDVKMKRADRESVIYRIIWLIIWVLPWRKIFILNLMILMMRFICQTFEIIMTTTIIILILMMKYKYQTFLIPIT